jgi:hypothetical protein
MRFEAIVHAPSLRAGVRLNIAASDQRPHVPPISLRVGADVRLRFGVCCPDLAKGQIVQASEHPRSVVIEIGGRRWTLLRHDEGGVTTPGLISESWYVADGEHLAA